MSLLAPVTVWWVVPQRRRARRPAAEVGRPARVAVRPSAPPTVPCKGHSAGAISSRAWREKGCEHAAAEHYLTRAGRYWVAGTTPGGNSGDSSSPRLVGGTRGELYGGGPALTALAQLRHDYPLSVHGVGLSLGSATALDTRHLARLRQLVTRLEPMFVSEHLSWSVAGGIYLNHLLPLPYTEETLDVVAQHVIQTQEVLQRRLLLENPSSYLRFDYSPIPEPEFLTALVQRTGCGLLCDVNNIHVSCCNLGGDPVAYLDALPAAAVTEIHLAGHAVNDADGQTILIDDHGTPVAAAVWTLYAYALARFGPVPTLIEWDTDIPALSVLRDEAHTAIQHMQQAQEAAYASVA